MPMRPRAIMTSGFPLGKRCPGAAVARYFEGFALHQNVHSFESAVIQQIPMALAWSPAKVPVPHIIDITRNRRFRNAECGLIVAKRIAQSVRSQESEFRSKAIESDFFSTTGYWLLTTHYLNFRHFSSF